MKISVLAENTPYSAEFAYEHGLCFYIETKKHKILFDTGQSALFTDNALKMGIDLGKVDIAVLSHGHYDHGGGIKRFFEINERALLYANRNVFGKYYNDSEKYIGLDSSLADNRRIVYTDDYFYIDDELELCTCNRLERKHPLFSAELTVRTENEYEPDNFLHEQYLLIRDGIRLVVISGCSHKGILNITEWLKPDVLIGGFHFMKQDLNKDGCSMIENAIRLLSESNTVFYTCHCTGTLQYKHMKNKMGDKLYYIAAGQKIII